jgi:hypothetical protein
MCFYRWEEKNILRIEEEQTTYKKHLMRILKEVDILLFCAPLCVFSFVEPNPYIGQGRITEVASKIF